MSKKIVSLVLTLLMVFSMTAAFAQETAITVTDMYDRTFTLDKPAERIVALTAADCEILCALGCEDKLVGRGAYCDYPASIQQITVVQSGAETNLEEILALEPQVVLMGDMAQDKEVVLALEEMGIKVAVSDANSIAEVFEAIRMIGAIAGVDAQAEALIADMQGTFDEIAAKSQKSEQTIYFEVSPLQYGLWTAGSNTFMDELANMCGLTNAFTDVDGWGAVSEEQVLARDPDVIVTIAMYFGEGPTPVEEILGRTGWQGLKAVANQTVFNADSDSISRPGPRLKDAAIELYNFLYGETAE